MTDHIALWLGFVIAAALGLDFFLNNAEASLFLAQKLLQLIEWLAFWR